MFDGWFPKVLIVALVLIMSLGIWAVIQDEKEWQAFKQAHHCKVIGKIAGYYTNGVGFYNGKTVTTMDYHPSQETWHCDDGINYTR